MKKILIVENNKDLGDALRDLLNDLGFSAYVEEDGEKARIFLEKTWVHLAIIDVRLDDDSDPNDFSGIDFARRIDTSIPKIIFSGYDTSKALKNALEPDLEGNIDKFYFMEKRDGPEKLIEIIKIAFENKINIDNSIKIMPDGIFDEEDFFNYEKAIQESGMEREDAREEIEEIFRRIFYKVKTIQITPLTGGLSGAGVVKVTPEYEGGLSNEIILKFGLKKYIQEEERNIKNYVMQFIGAMHTTFVLDSAHTLNFQGTAYAFIGSPLGDVLSFEDYYNSKDNESEIIEVVNNLFNKTCEHWYNNMQKPILKNLREYYESELSLTKNALIDCYKEYWGNNGSVGKIKDAKDFEDWVNEIWDPKRDLTVKTYKSCITHGDLNRNNILIDKKTKCAWLIDFYRTKESYALRDFIRLETAIKFELIKSTDQELIDNFERLLTKYDLFSEFEKADWDENITDDELRKAFCVIKKIRYWAKEKTVTDEMKGYYIGLLFQTLKFLTWDSSWKLNYNVKHILSSALFISEKLKDW